MGDIDLTDLRGIWLGDQYNVIVGCFDDGNYGSLVIKAEKRIEETRNLSLSDITEKWNTNAEIQLRLGNRNLGMGLP